jgi:hypothetical protein
VIATPTAILALEARKLLCAPLARLHICSLRKKAAIPCARVPLTTGLQETSYSVCTDALQGHISTSIQLLRPRSA